VRRRQVSRARSAAFTSSAPARRHLGFDETQSRHLEPAEDRPGRFAIRKGVRCAGVHLIIEPHGAERLDDIDYIEATLRCCAKASHATLLRMYLQHFK
jgi:S-adenosylmethionine decarboxylase